MAAEVMALSTNLIVSLSHFEDWAVFKREALGDDGLAEEIMQQAAESFAAVAEIDIIEEEVVQELAKEASAIFSLEGVGGTQLERSSFVRGVSNAFATLSKIVLKTVKDFGEAIYKGAAKAPEEFAKYAMLLGLLAVSDKLLALAGLAPQWFGWLRTLVAFLTNKLG